MPTAADDYFEGTHFYAGLGRMHFGHYLLESATRFWALPDCGPVQSAIYASMAEADLDRALRQSLRGIHGALSGDLAHKVLKTPARFERLIVPTQGFGHGAWIGGTDAFREHARDCLSVFPSDGPERLYISRRQLGAARQRVDQEALIEAAVQEAGYTVFHPEKHELQVQIAHYRAAQRVLGGDGSAFHLLALVARPDLRVGLILRRNRPEMLDLLSHQLQAFAKLVPDCFDPRLPLEDQRKIVPEGANAPTPLDVDKLLQALAEAGYL